MCACVCAVCVCVCVCVRVCVCVWMDVWVCMVTVCDHKPLDAAVLDAVDIDTGPMSP